MAILGGKVVVPEILAFQWDQTWVQLLDVAVEFLPLTWWADDNDKLVVVPSRAGRATGDGTAHYR
jgi:hypothetical protein